MNLSKNNALVVQDLIHFLNNCFVLTGVSLSLPQRARRSQTPCSTRCGLWAVGRIWTAREQRATARGRRKMNFRAALLFITVTTWVIYFEVVLALFKGIVSLLCNEIWMLNLLIIKTSVSRYTAEVLLNLTHFYQHKTSELMSHQKIQQFCASVYLSCNSSIERIKVWLI